MSLTLYMTKQFLLTNKYPLPPLSSTHHSYTSGFQIQLQFVHLHTNVQNNIK